LNSWAGKVFCGPPRTRCARALRGSVLNLPGGAYCRHPARELSALSKRSLELNLARAILPNSCLRKTEASTPLSFLDGGDWRAGKRPAWNPSRVSADRRVLLSRGPSRPGRRPPGAGHVGHGQDRLGRQRRRPPPPLRQAADRRHHAPQRDVQPDSEQTLSSGNHGFHRLARIRGCLSCPGSC